MGSEAQILVGLRPSEGQLLQSLPRRSYRKVPVMVHPWPPDPPMRYHHARETVREAESWDWSEKIRIEEAKEKKVAGRDV